MKRVATATLERKLKENEDQRKREKIKEIKRKKNELIRNIINKNYLDNEAEEGSDNEDHDDIIKAIDRKAEEEEEKEAFGDGDLDNELRELIDDGIEK